MGREGERNRIMKETKENIGTLSRIQKLTNSPKQIVFLEQSLWDDRLPKDFNSGGSLFIYLASKFHWCGLPS